MKHRDKLELAEQQQLGRFFTQFRLMKGRTQRELGEAAGLGQAAVTNFERTQSDFRFSTVQRIAKAFGYRIELVLVPLEGDGERIVAVPNEDSPLIRAEFKTAMGHRFPSKYNRTAGHKPIQKKKKAPKAEVSKDQDSGKFDMAYEMALSRKNLGVPREGDADILAKSEL